GCFFFAGRSGHTRLVSDWSSDVCSPDLEAGHAGIDEAEVIRRPDRLDVVAPRPDRLERIEPAVEDAADLFVVLQIPAVNAGRARSEERRVGKEGRSRGGPGDERKTVEK